MRRTTTAAIFLLLAPLLVHSSPAPSIVPKPASHHKTTSTSRSQPTKPPVHDDDYVLIDFADLPPPKYHFPTVAVQVHEHKPHTHFGPGEIVQVSRYEGMNTTATLLAFDLSEATDPSAAGGPYVSSVSTLGKDDKPHDKDDKDDKDDKPGDVGNTKYKNLCKLEFLEPIIPVDKENVPFIEVYLLNKSFNPKKTGWYNKPDQVRIVGAVDVENALVTQIGDENEPGFGGWPCDPKGKVYLEVTPFITGIPEEDIKNIDVKWHTRNFRGLVIVVEKQFLKDN